MLSEQHQKLILMIYMNYLEGNPKSIAFDDARGIYSSRPAFKRAVRYLSDSKYVKANDIGGNNVVYSLTITGEILARVLCNMSDLPDHVRKMKWRLLW